ncbi:hypothetical protein CIL05_09910 [Virgibacillus profundi]|uniref:Uncharacterized protein n=1 Tax=Virgibacillus profundi TaxID=2024555 RepID=A0A2A2ID73_9BACI|nr:hypothetical protein [Virgibacillus profundi]PAV29679.1 hypothetical protein CIL05_09910 [Virgibacillus profundi]PXY53851.1 hypothetical protein CIT14_10005 [Virgibacillus profundi]
MKNNPKLALIISLIVIVGIPLFFLVLSLITGNWNFFYFSLIPAWFAGFTGVIHSIKQLKEIKGKE